MPRHKHLTLDDPCPHPARNGRHETYIAKGKEHCRACGAHEHSYMQDVVVLAAGAIDKAIEDGFLKGKPSLSDEGRKRLALLKAEGFEPDQDDLDEASMALLHRDMKKRKR